MSIADAAQSIVDILGSNQGTISLGVAAAVAMGSPLVDRLLIRRKRVQYQVLYNSKIGLSPVLLGSDGDDPPSVPTNPQLDHLAELLEYLSVVIVRIRNTGSYDITESDFEPPLSFTFGSRVVWDARVSEASDPQLRRHIRENMQFFNPDPVGTPKRAAETAGEDYRNLPTLRRWLAPRLSAWLTPATSSVLVDSAEPQWHGVRLARLWLRRKQSFILVVVLRETNSDATEITKDYRVTGGHSTGKTIIDERRQRRFGWPVVATAIGVLLVGALLATLIVGHGRQAIPGVPCTRGTVRLAGSSAFGPIVSTLGDKYTAVCPGTHVDVDSSGSIDGIRDLGAVQGVLSDGAVDQPSPGLARQLVAVLVYSVLINRGVGIDSLSGDQLSGIYSGRYTNWSQLGGPSLPIRLVGRGEGSGTRRAFEKFVLDGSEGELSSDACLTRDRGFADAPTIRCERGTTEELIHTVATVPGAIGYGDVANAATKAAVRAGDIVPVRLNGRSPQVDSLPDYPFWTVEYLYTQGAPAPGSPMRDFLDYLQSDSAQASLLSAGYTPCVPKNGVLNSLCTSR